MAGRSTSSARPLSHCGAQGVATTMRRGETGSMKEVYVRRAVFGGSIGLIAVIVLAVLIWRAQERPVGEETTLAEASIEAPAESVAAPETPDPPEETAQQGLGPQAAQAQEAEAQEGRADAMAGEDPAEPPEERATATPEPTVPESGPAVEAPQ